MTAIEGLRGALSGRYAIDRELGRGGMATVYLATDLKVGRSVAIKVLNPELAAALGGERFHREIRIASNLTHPNILPVHDSGEADGTLYYVMPFVEGESLRDRLNRERQLGIDEAIRITCQVANALEHAHAAGIVHRDIKPENILLESGHAVVADFGIARAVTSVADAETLTRTGMSLGTPAYMSPEQAMGERTLDGRSDQYALACVAYEMLAGQPPFTATTMQALVARHIAEQVPLITTVRQAVPDEVQDVILQALEKVPADRFPSMAEFAEALADAGSMTMTATSRRAMPSRTMRHPTRTNRLARRGSDRWSRRRQMTTAAAVLLLASTGAGVWIWDRPTASASAGAIGGSFDPRRIAVLYFDDQSRGGELGPLSTGLTESLIDRLNQVRTLDPISRNGVAPFRGVDVDVDSVATLLRVGTIVRGSIDTAGARIRVDVRLIDGNSGTEIKRASFSRPRGDLIVLQDSLAVEVARFLQVRLGEEVHLRERRASTRSTDAWLLLQRAEKLRRDADDVARRGESADAAAALLRADSVLTAAEVADPSWLEPIVARGWLALRRADLEKGLKAAPQIDVALAHATRALQRVPNHPEAVALRGTSRFQKWRLRESPDPATLAGLLQNARRDLESAVAADPSLARANIALSYLYYQTEPADVPGALLAARHAYEEDAYLEDADRTLFRLFWGSVDLEQFGEARRWCAEGAGRFPRDFRFRQCQLWLMVTPAVPAEVDRAWRLLASLDTLAPAPQRAFVSAQGHLLVAGALARAGLTDSARSVLRRNRQRITHETDPEQGARVAIDPTRARHPRVAADTILDRVDDSAEPEFRFENENPSPTYRLSRLHAPRAEPSFHAGVAHETPPLPPRTAAVPLHLRVQRHAGGAQRGTRT
jgi:serine/threonine protein kinase/TolB-like protein